MSWERLGIDDINLGTTEKQLQWYGQVLLKEDNDWVKKCTEYEVGGLDQEVDKRGPGEVVEKNCQAHKLNKEDAVDRCRWSR